jgi:two-component system phosphate regulon sensor histidine kinase PhoR
LQRIKTRNRDVASTEEYRREFLGNVSHELNPFIYCPRIYFYTSRQTMEDKAIRYLNVPKRSVLYIVEEDLDMITKLESGDLNLVY